MAGRKRPPRKIGQGTGRRARDAVDRLMDGVDSAGGAVESADVQTSEGDETSERSDVQTSKRPEETSERSDVKTSKPKPVPKPKRRKAVRRPPKPKGTGIQWRAGRLLGDGSRRGAGWVKRATIYLEPELAARLDQRARAKGQDVSTVVSAAVRAYLDSDA